MGKVMLLDCTLRDGGYVNDWNFGHDNLINIYERLVDAGIDVIELGFLDERRSFDINHSIMPNTDCMEKIYGTPERKNSMLVGMIDYGTCSLENIRPCKESILDGIRVIFKKHLRKEAVDFCKEIKTLGYKVFVQLVSVTSYSDEEMRDLIRLVNIAKPFAVSMVDTYGLMHQDNLKHYFDLLNAELLPEITIGYHAHNNFQMGYANCISLLSNKIDRTLMVDGSIYGMGKSAGNTPIELIAMYMNHSLGKHYHISQILEAVDVNISQFYQPSTWGYNMFYYLAASNDCHPNYVAYLMEKRTLSVKSINEILKKLEGETKLLFDKRCIEKLYFEYQVNDINDSSVRKQLKNELDGKKILIVGPGTTMQTQKDKIEKHIKDESLTVISINYIPSYIEPDYIFLSNSKRYVQLAAKLHHKHYNIIATSNVTGTYKDAFKYVLNFSTLIDETAEIIDNSLIMLLKTLISIDVSDVTLAGFDGYTSKSPNYFNSSMEYDFIKDKAEYLNGYTKNFLKEISDKLTVRFLTDSVYAQEE